MASTIGQGAWGQPTRIPIPNTQFSGSTSGIGGQSTETVYKYDPTYTHAFRYMPGSKRFTKLGRGNYIGPTGNWGMRVLQKVNLRKQVSGSAGVLSADPKARLKPKKFIALNYGRQVVDPFLPRGGSIPRVVDTSNVEDPRSYYSDFNWGNGPQPHHDSQGGTYYTIPPNGTFPPDPYAFKDKEFDKELEYTTPPKPPNTPQEVSQAQSRQETFEQLNPMLGRNQLGLGGDMEEYIQDRLAGLEAQQNERQETEDDEEARLAADLGIGEPGSRRNSAGERVDEFLLPIPGDDDFARRRASNITQLYNQEVDGTYINNVVMDERSVTQSSGRGSGGNTEMAGGSGELGGIATKPAKLKSENKPVKMEGIEKTKKPKKTKKQTKAKKQKSESPETPVSNMDISEASTPKDKMDISGASTPKPKSKKGKKKGKKK